MVSIQDITYKKEVLCYTKEVKEIVLFKGA